MHLPRQAAQQFERSRVLAPNMAATEYALAETYVNSGKGEMVLELVSHVRQSSTNPASKTNDLNLELSILEARAWYSLTNPVQGRAVLESVLQQHPGDDHAMNQVTKAYILSGDYAYAQKVNVARLALRPNDVMLLNNQATLLLNLGDTTNAIIQLNRVLAVTNLPVARFNRALAAMNIGDLAAAETDYLELENAQVEPLRVQMGLAEIAALRHDTNQAIRRLTFCVSNAPPGSGVWRAAKAKLAATNPGGSGIGK
jgi:predicted Zn-dependent protease